MKSFLIVVVAFVGFISLASVCGASAAEEGKALEETKNLEPAKIKRSIWFPLGFYTPETSAGVGIINIYKLKTYAPGKVDQILSNIAVTAKGQSIANLTSKVYRDNDQGEFFGNLNYSYFPSKYYGQGQSKVSNSDGEAFTENNLGLGLGASQNFVSKLAVRASLNYEEKRISKVDQGTYLNTLLSTSTDSIQAFGGNLGFEWDDRDYLQSPTDGRLYRLQTTYLNMKDLKGSFPIPVFTKYELDLREYWSFASDYVFAAQFFLSDIPGSQFVPFQYLNNMGGGSRLRGLISGKYRDRSLGLAQGELRYHFKEKWYAHGFLGSAKISDSVENLSKASAKYSAGLGFQYLLDQESRTKLRFDVGFSDGESGVYVVIGEAF